MTRTIATKTRKEKTETYRKRRTIYVQERQEKNRKDKIHKEKRNETTGTETKIK